MISLLRTRFAKTLSALMIVTALLGWAAALPTFASIPQPAAYIIVDPALSSFPPPNMAVGSTFNINVSLVNITNVEGVQFELTWDHSLLNCTSMTEILFHTKTPSAYWGNIWNLAFFYNNAAGTAEYAQTWEESSTAQADGYAPLNVTTAAEPPGGKLAAATFTFEVLKVPTTAQGNLTCAFHLTMVAIIDPKGNPIIDPSKSTGNPPVDGTYVNACTSALLEAKNGWYFTNSTRDDPSLSGSSTGYNLTAGQILNVSWSATAAGMGTNSMRFYLLNSSQIGGWEWVNNGTGQYEETTLGYLIKLDSWATTVGCLINSTGAYYVILVCESSSYDTLDLLPPEINVNFYAAYALSPPLVSITPGSVAMDLGQSQLFASSVTNGTSPYTYQWFLNGTAVSGATSPTWTFVPNSSRSYNVYVQVTDNAGFSPNSNIATITVNPVPSVTISQTSAVMDVGQSQTFTSTVSGGMSPYSYQWYLNGGQIAGANSSSWVFTPQSEGSYNQIYVMVTDGVEGQARSNTATVTVNSLLSASISPSSVVLNVVESQLFTSTVSGGTSPYTYQWYLNGAPVSGATNPTWNFTLTPAGLSTVYIKVKDSIAGQATSNNATVTVNIGTHDVSVTNVTSSKTVVGQGFNASITVTAANQGNFTEVFNVTAYANATIIGSGNVTLLAGDSMPVTFTWNTKDFAYGNYTISAYAWPVSGETNTANNNLTGGTVEVTIPGDFNGHGTVDIFDAILLSEAFNSKPGSPNWNPNADIIGDGTVDIYDAIIMAAYFGQSIP